MNHRPADADLMTVLIEQDNVDVRDDGACVTGKRCRVYGNGCVVLGDGCDIYGYCCRVVGNNCRLHTKRSSHVISGRGTRFLADGVPGLRSEPSDAAPPRVLASRTADRERERSPPPPPPPAEPAAFAEKPAAVDKPAYAPPSLCERCSLHQEPLRFECVMCLSERPTWLCRPCNHLCLCDTCSSAFAEDSVECLVCSKPVTSLMEVYLP